MFRYSNTIEKKDKAIARVGDESGDEDLPFIDRISNLSVVGKKRKLLKNLFKKPTWCTRTLLRK